MNNYLYIVSCYLIDENIFQNDEIFNNKNNKNYNIKNSIKNSEIKILIYKKLIKYYYTI